MKRRRPAYTFEEFMDHMNAQEHFLAYESVNRHGEEIDLPPLEKDDHEGKFMQTVFRVHDYFSQCYSDEAERIYKSGRFILMLEFLSRHISSFDQGRLAVHGKAGSAVSEALLRAVHECFAGTKLPEKTDSELVKVLIKRAEQIAGELDPEGKSG